ncbi:MAG TPA: helix-turn-helix domain-containing protein [Guyparkeria sp.]|nr:helix-turn-helix domain-containing protein [Guyparkeria sp.]
MSKPKHHQGHGPSIRVVRNYDRFSIVPDNLILDNRLSPIARLIGIYLIGRPDDWDIRISDIRKNFGLGEDAWKRARRQLESAGYYTQERRKVGSGKWSWTYYFHYPPLECAERAKTTRDGLSGDGGDTDVSVCRNEDNQSITNFGEETGGAKTTIVGSSIDGSSIDGEPADILIGNNQYSSGSGGSNSRKRLSEQLDLSHLVHLDPGYQRQTAALLDDSGLSVDLAQQAIDELTGAIRHRAGTDDPIRKPIPYLRALLSRAQDGTLTPDHAPRERQVRLGLIDPESSSESASADAMAADPEAQKLQRQLRQEWDALFDSHFWPNVWKKHDKQNARKAWNKLCPKSQEEGQQLLDAIMAGAERYKAFLAANPDRSVKYPQGWLNSRRWEDEFDQQDMTGNAVIGRERVLQRKSALDEVLDGAREYIAQEGL